MAQNPVERQNRATELICPFNLRPLLASWNLGHCSESHTPRNLAYARKVDAHLQGNVIEDALAHDITPAGLAQRVWNADGLEQFLGRGLSPQGVMTFMTFRVLSHSTKYMTPEDIAAVSADLTQGAPAPTPPEPRTGAIAQNADGHNLYLCLCAGCHVADGEGQLYGSVSMRSNTSAMFDNPLDLVGELMALVNYLRQRWGDHKQALPVEAVTHRAKEAQIGTDDENDNEGQ
ncbi:hypothetical protein DC366_04290 [Pelagivirga sediminicola]|uniref:Cytochrome c domain-containing protein n=2 Tax=Pelagivirga sediminicola TaxID=2170575 RepID=A0A2T7G9A6_9RHOB|nr:hypothetical protein DC366_04290 [Pelagivirga sediminicola]